ncbi:MAG: hypothetical protein QOD77_488 [Thermoplasmata archaeon]|jgi:outer membrane murein-binding lipoprotein Lpp|nr:hypothetical protein [Thermoplasmata archaeon]
MRDDGAQLMLLAAVILGLGFLAVTILSAKVAQVPGDVAAQTGPALGPELAALREGLCTAFDDATPATATERDALLGHFEQLEAQRGYVAALEDDGGTLPEFRVRAFLSDGRSSVRTVWDSLAVCP